MFKKLFVLLLGCFALAPLAANGQGTAPVGAPISGPYLTKTPHNQLSQEFALSSLATGILKNATGTGIPTIAVAGTDYVIPDGDLTDAIGWQGRIRTNADGEFYLSNEAGSNSSTGHLSLRTIRLYDPTLADVSNITVDNGIYDFDNATGTPATILAGNFRYSNLGTGIVKNTLNTGASLAVAGTDYLAPSAIGVTVQGYSMKLSALDGATWANNKLFRMTGADTVGTIDFLDEDDMVSDSATAVPSQQSVKAYVDAAVFGSGGGAPTNATYVTNTSHAGLDAEQALSGLTTGLMKVTNGTGLISTGVAGTDYLAPAAIGVTVQAQSAKLQALHALTWANNKLFRMTGTGTVGTIDFLDEDAMTSNSDTAVPSQQSTKAYVDAQVATAAPPGAGYWTKTSNGTLSNEFDMSSLATGILKNTTGTGIPTIAVAGTDYMAASTKLAALDAATWANNKLFRLTGTNTVGTIDFLDEDTLVSDSDMAVPSQQSVKAYIDAAVLNAGAPTNATYLVTTLHTSLSNEIAIGTSSTVGQILRTTGANAYGWGALDLSDADAITGDLPFTNFVEGTALSVIGRSANTTGDVANIQAGTDGFVLRRSGTTLGFGLLDLTASVTGDLPFSNFTQAAALSVLGNATNGAADFANIQAGADHQVLRRSGTAIGFGSIDLSQGAAVTGILPDANIASTITRDSEAAAAYQPLDATLTAAAGLATGANKIPRSTGTDTFDQLDFKDEDDMSSDSATALPSQQSTKAYKDTVRVTSAASTSSLTPTITTDHQENHLTALAANLNVNAPTGTIVNGRTLLVRINDNGTARTITWDAIFQDAAGERPNTTVVGETTYVLFKYNSAATKWDCLAPGATTGGPGGGAPTDAGYWTKTANGTLSNEFDMSSLATGIVKNTTSTGIPTIAVAGTDYVAPDATLTALAGLATGASKVPMSTGTDTFTQIDFKDEDDMVSNSATAVPSQQSVKAYVDANSGFPSPPSEDSILIFDFDTMTKAWTPYASQTASELLETIGNDLGDMLVHNGTDWVELNAGTEGQVLSMASGSPVWATGAGGGAPTDATYLTTSTNGTLSAEVSVGTSSTVGQMLRVTGSNTYAWSNPYTSNTGTSSSSLTPTIVSYLPHTEHLTALAANIIVNAPTGTPTDGQSVVFRFKDNGTARTITWNAIYQDSLADRPTTTVVGETLYVAYRYNAADSKYDCVVGEITPVGGLVDLTSDVTGDLPFANFTQGTALSVIGNSTNATADVSNIQAGTDGYVLRRSGTTLGFGLVDLTASVTGTLPVANGGTGITAFGTGVATALGQNVTGSGSIVLSSAPTIANGAFNGVITFDNGSTSAGRFSIFEDADSTGTESILFTVPADVTANRTQTFPDADGNVVLDSATQVLTNKDINLRVRSQVGPATLTPEPDNYDMEKVTAQDETLTVANPTSPNEGDTIRIRIKDNGTTRTINWGSDYIPIGEGVVLPTATVANKVVWIIGTYDSTDTQVDVLAVGQEQ